MRYRKLRIAWSVGWGLLAVLLVVLWVRSYSRSEEVIWVSSGGRVFWLGSELGGVTLIYEANYQVGAKLGAGWTRIEEQIPAGLSQQKQPWIFGRFGWGSRMVNRTAVTVPHWLLVCGCGIPAALPWVRLMRLRFRLRTLLIATTLIAVVLGVVVYATR